MKNKIPALALLAWAALFASGGAMAQVFTNLCSFTNGTDGADPQAGLLLAGGTLFGMASGGGGTNISGTAYSIGTLGGNFSTIHTFSLSNTNAGSVAYTNSNDGTDPQSIFVLSGGALYGTAYAGGTNGSGTVFAVNPNGGGFTTLQAFGPVTSYMSAGTYTNGEVYTNYLNFTNSDGSYPCPGLVLAGNTLYGTTEYGGTNGCGTIFAINTNGTGFTALYNFSLAVTNPVTGIYTNGDGANPAAGLVLYGNTLYGTAQYGGTNGSGTVFAINTNGTGYTTLYNFSATGSNFVTTETYTNNIYTNNDGAYPVAGLVASGNMLYGVAEYGGTNGCGTIFEVSTNGNVFATLHSFGLENYNAATGKLTNSDGVNPQATLLLSGNTLYGTAYAGGPNDSGTIFSINTDGSCFTTLYTFSQQNYNGPLGVNTNTDGAFPEGSLVFSGNTLYGTTAGGGTNGQGAVFAFNLGPIPIVPSQNLFEADEDSGNIYEFTANGTQSTFASGLSFPMALAFNSAGDLFVANSGGDDVIEIAPDGSQSTFASGISEPTGLAFDGAGNLYVSCQNGTGIGGMGDGTIYEFTPGGGQSIFTSGLLKPGEMAFNSTSNLFVLVYTNGSGLEGDLPGHGAIIEITPAGMKSTFASGWTNPAVGLTFNSGGTLFVANNSASGSITEFTSGGSGFTYATGFDNPLSLVFNSAGNMFVANSGANNIMEITAAGQGTFASGLDYPSGLAFEPAPESPALAVQGTVNSSGGGGNGAFQFTLSVSSPAYSIIIQASTNLVNWQTIYTNIPPFTFTDSMTPEFPSRFYRALIAQ